MRKLNGLFCQFLQFCSFHIRSHTNILIGQSEIVCYSRWNHSNKFIIEWRKNYIVVDFIFQIEQVSFSIVDIVHVDNGE